MLYKNHQEVDKEYEADFLTSKKGIVNQGSEEIPDITIGEIELALKKTKNNRSPGEDNIMSDAIRIGGQSLLEKLRDLFNLCLFNRWIPKGWHDSIVILLHKKGDTADLENYRPISLLSHLYKLFTRIITTARKQN